MSRNGLKAVESNEPNELYDSLNQEAKDIWDEIGSLGYTPEQGAQSLWFARKAGQTAAEALGPADSLQALRSIVKAKIAEEAPADGESGDGFELSNEPEEVRLAGMEEPDIEELNRQADRVLLAMEKKGQAKTACDDEYDRMINLMDDHGRKRYSRRGKVFVNEEKHRLVVQDEKKTAKPKEPKEPKEQKKAA